MMKKNVVSRLLCAGLSASMMLSMGAVAFADDDWTIDVEAMKEEAAAKDNKDIKLAEISLLTLYFYKIPFFSLLCARSLSIRKNTHKLPLSHL